MTCCLGPWAAKLSARRDLTPAKVRASWAKLPEACAGEGCSPGGCRQNCKDYAAGLVQQLNAAKPDAAPPKSKGRGK